MIWGASFAAMKVCLDAGLSVGAMLAIRFSLGALGLGLLAHLLGVRFHRQAVRDGIILGLWITAVFWLQADGLRFTTPSKSAFITGLYLVFTPLLSLAWGDRLKPSHLLGLLTALLGLFLLVHEPGVRLGGWNRGDSETLVCAVACGFHITLTTHFAQRSNGWVLAFVQVAMVAVVSWILVPLVPSNPLPNGTRLGGLEGLGPLLRTPTVWIALGFQAVLATTLAFWIMATLQKDVSPTEAAVLYSLEPLFAALLAMTGWVPGVQEHLRAVQWAGGGLILLAMLVAELGPRMIRRQASAAPSGAGEEAS